MCPCFQTFCKLETNLRGFLCKLNTNVLKTHFCNKTKALTLMNHEKNQSICLLMCVDPAFKSLVHSSIHLFSAKSFNKFVNA